ncbi:MAG TPA: cytochrome c biogenesis protein ResB, partial [Salinivirgaceae bacterium]|nr:cytochrome c biogenesis protein ResB [Salinivirgaceae bacterium]
VLAFFLELFVPLSLFPKPAFPYNAIVLVATLCLLILFKNIFPKSFFFNWLASAKAAIPSISLFLFSIILMGIIPQIGHGMGIPGALFNLLDSWLLLIPLIFMLFALGAAIINRIFPFNSKNIIFTLNHTGLWICLSAGLVGGTDKIEATIKVNRGEIAWYGTTKDGSIIELPIAIELQKFEAQFYQPRLALMGSKTFFPESEYDLAVKPKVKIDNLTIQVMQYLPKAFATDSSFIDARGVPFTGPAAMIQIFDLNGQTISMGWISSPTYVTAEKTLPLPDGRVLRLLPAEPKYFGSHVKIYSKKSSSVKKCIIEVNKPARIDGWWIYQYSYDNLAGSESSYSSFKAVYDPWLPLIYLGFAMMLLGGLGLVFINNSKK